MKKYLIFTYALLGYLSALISLTFLIFWVYPWEFMPITVDKADTGTYAIMIDSALILLFALQHSIMARPFFKETIFAHISLSVRASTYSLLSSLCLLMLFYFWQPIEGYLWDFQSGGVFWILTLVYLLGWTFAFIATFLIDHFELFGLHQGYRVLKGLPEPEVSFQRKWFYNIIRHPIQAGTLVGLWATPSMSYGHLLLSIGMTIYVLIGLYLEEKDLLTTLGDDYKIYKREVPMLLPFTKATQKE